MRRSHAGTGDTLTIGTPSRYDPAVLRNLVPIFDALALMLTLPARLGQLRRPAIRSVLARQLYFTGWQALPTVLLVGSATGLIFAIQLQGYLGGNSAVTLKMLNRALFVEIGPLLTGIVLLARSGSAVATELATMRVSGEIASHEALAIPARDYLVLPRVLAAVLAGPCLCLYLELAALGSAALVVLASGAQGLSALLPEILTGTDVLWSLLKSVLFAGWISAMTCTLGLSAGFAQTAVPIAASRAVMTSLLGLFVIDGLIALCQSAGAALA